MKTPPDAQPALPLTALYALALLLPLALLAPSLGYDFVWDDLWIIAANPHVTGLSDWMSLFLADAYQGYYWRPLVLASFRLDWWLGGGSPVFFHAVNLLFFALCLVLLGRLLKANGLPLGVQVAVLFLWALHPTKVEPVVFISARDNLLLGFWVLLALLETERARSELPRIRAGRLARLVVLMALALFTKEAGAVLPLLIAWTLLTPGPSPGRGRFLLSVGLAWILIALPYFYLRAHVLGDGDAVLASELGLLHRLAMPIYLLSHYLSLWAWPVLLLPDRFDTTHWTPANLAALWPHALIFVAFTLSMVLAWLRFRPVAYWLGVFLILLAPVLNLLPTPGRLTSDTWLFLPSIGLAVALVLLAARLTTLARRPNMRQVFVLLTCLLVLTPCALGQVTYLPVWRNDRTLFHHSLTAQPENPRPYAWFGNRAIDQGDFEKARFFFTSGLQANPRFGDNLLGLALVEILTDRRDAAQPLLERLMEIEPGHEGGAYYLARLAFERGDWDAARHFAGMTQVSRRFPERLWVLAESCEKLGRADEAARWMEGFCRLRPQTPVCQSVENIEEIP